MFGTLDRAFREAIGLGEMRAAGFVLEIPGMGKQCEGKAIKLTCVVSDDKMRGIPWMENCRLSIRMTVEALMSSNEAKSNQPEYESPRAR